MTSVRATRVAVVLLLSHVQHALWATDAKPIGLVGVARFAQAPKLDGVLDDPCWRLAPAALCLYELRDGPPYPVAAARAVVKLGFDDQALYLACLFHYDDPVTRGKHTWREDWIHVVIDPHNVPGPAGGLDYVFYSRGAARVDRIGGGGRYEHVPSPKRTAAFSRGKAGWAMEVRFPYAELGRRAQPGQVWSFALARHRVMRDRKTGKEWVDRTSVSPGGHERRQANQGFIVFGSTPVRAMQALAHAAESRYGKRWDLHLSGGVVAHRQRADEDRRLRRQVRRSARECAAFMAGLADTTLAKELGDIRQQVGAALKMKDRSAATAKLAELKVRVERLRGAILVRRLAGQQ